TAPRKAAAATVTVTYRAITPTGVDPVGRYQDTSNRIASGTAGKGSGRSAALTALANLAEAPAKVTIRPCTCSTRIGVFAHQSPHIPNGNAETRPSMSVAMNREFAFWFCGPTTRGWTNQTTAAVTTMPARMTNDATRDRCLTTVQSSVWVGQRGTVRPLTPF